MIYVVAGFGRSGTSLMMRMLAHSGIKPWYDKLREAGLKRHNRPDYVVNESFLEVSPQDFMRLGFARHIPDGRCVKYGIRGVAMMSPGDYGVILMHRDPRSIMASFEAAKIEHGVTPEWIESYPKLMDEIAGIIKVRRDMKLVSVQYEDLVANPMREIRRIREVAPVNYDAARLVNPELYRHRVA